MGVMSIRELNANTSKAIALAEAGEIVEITRNGKTVAEIRAKSRIDRQDPEYRRKYAEMIELMRQGIPGLKGPATYEERTEG